MPRIVCIIVAALSIIPLANAQPLADRVPADALLYFGWSGSENIGATYDQSRLKAVLAALRRLGFEPPGTPAT